MKPINPSDQRECKPVKAGDIAARLLARIGGTPPADNSDERQPDDRAA